MIAPSRLHRAARGFTVALGGVLVAAWLAAALGRPAPLSISRALVAGLLASAAAWSLAAARRASAEAHAGRTERLELSLFALAALAVYWLGVTHEVGGYYYWDEGIYAQRASQINSGELLVPNFIYPHLLFYLEAIVQWVANLAPAGLADRLVRLPSVQVWPVFHRLLYRLVVASFGALAVVPVYLAARNVGGRTAARWAGVAAIFSPVLLFGAKLNTCDVPSAFFATVCLYYVSRLVLAETTRDYVAAGIAAGLAAGSKYPAGFVAVAIVAVWLVWRGRERRFSAGLAWAGVAAVAALLATTPALLAHPEVALDSPRSVFFGVRQYTRQGWVGVIADSNLRYYAGLAMRNFGWAAVVGAALGLAAAAGETRKRALLLAPYPVAFLAALSTNSMVVERSLYPILPALAVFVGVGLAALAAAASRRAGDNVLVAVALPAILLVSPVARSLLFDLAALRPSTRDLAQEWFLDRFPPGTAIYKERYTPNVGRRTYQVLERRFGPRFPFEQLQAEWDYVVLADRSYGRWFEENVAEVEHFEEFQDWYRRVFEEMDLVAEFEPGLLRLGPEIKVLRAHPRDERSYLSGRSYAAPEIFRPDHKRAKAGGAVGFRRGGGWGVVKGDFRDGPYRVTVDGELVGEARLIVWSSANEAIASLDLAGGASPPFELPENGRYYFQVTVGKGSWIRGIDIGPDQ